MSAALVGHGEVCGRPLAFYSGQSNEVAESVDMLIDRLFE